MLPILCLAAALVTFHASDTAAQDASRTIDVATLGPQTGQAAPDFRLQDGAGRWWTRDSLMGPEGLMLVFSRSADWCPYCKTQIIELQRRADELKRRGLGVAVITYDAPALLADFSTRRAIAFPLLADEGSRTIKAFGIFNTTVDPASSSYGIPFPGTFIINRAGIVTSRFFEPAYQERTTVSNIFLKLGQESSGGTPATRITTDHLQAVTYATDAVIAPGSLFSLVVDIRPRPGMHLYAPGSGYRVVSLALEDNPLLVLRPVQYPPHEIYHFEPLDERVPVFQQPFRLVQELAISTSREARASLAKTGTLTLGGTFEYQACDDKICYAPASIPVSYTLKVVPLDTERKAAP